MAGGLAAPGAMAGAVDLGSETKNEVETTHYRIDSSSVVGSLASLPPGAAVDLWVSAEGFLVSMALSGGTEGIVIDVFDINDPSITVERPS